MNLNEYKYAGLVSTAKAEILRLCLHQKSFTKHDLVILLKNKHDITLPDWVIVECLKGSYATKQGSEWISTIY